MDYFRIPVKFLFPAIFVALVFSCRKATQENPQNNLIIQGRWELVSYSCGECPNPFTTYQPGNGNILEFNASSQFIRKVNSAIVFNGVYKVFISKECEETGNLALQTNEAAYATAYFISIQDNQLQLSTPVCYADGGISTYRRIP